MRVGGALLSWFNFGPVVYTGASGPARPDLTGPDTTIVTTDMRASIVVRMTSASSNCSNALPLNGAALIPSSL